MFTFLTGFCFGLLLSSLLVCFALTLTAANGRGRRQGGYVRPRVSPGTNPATMSTTRLTRRVAAYTSSSTAPGGASAATATRPQPPQTSSGTARGFSGTAPAATGASGRPLLFVVSDDPWAGARDLTASSHLLCRVRRSDGEGDT